MQTIMTKGQHKKEANSLLQAARKLLADDGYVKYKGYNEINVLLKMADIHERLSR